MAAIDDLSTSVDQLQDDLSQLSTFLQTLEGEVTTLQQQIANAPNLDPAIQTQVARIQSIAASMKALVPEAPAPTPAP